MASSLPVMTYNIGSARPAFDVAWPHVVDVIRRQAPDVLLVQEVGVIQRADGTQEHIPRRLAEALGFGEHVFFGPVLSLQEDMDVRSPRFVDALFRDLRDWSIGNAILCRNGFVRLSEPAESGQPRNVPLYRPPRYQGNRDSEPRHALLARVGQGPVFPFVIGVHLSTLVGERSAPDGGAPMAGRANQARARRLDQTRRLADLLTRHVLDQNQVAFLLGDFNAQPDEACITSVLVDECGFCRLAPAYEAATHLGVGQPIDHIFAYPADRLLDVDCRVVDTDAARCASDHLPVVADVTFT
jgi:endonuclease/exonuclease/phosphatase family metal-dependent hydrolase